MAVETGPGGYARPLPVVNDLNRAHWEGARRGEFLVQRCGACGHRWFPPAPNCCRCLESERIDWTAVSGRGRVFSFIVYHQAWLPGFADEVPYNVAIIELEEGVRIINNVVGAPNEALRIGMPVEVAFDEVAPEVTIPRFRAML